MDLLAYVPDWDDIERNLDHKFSQLSQGISSNWHDSWNGVTRRVSTSASQAYGYMGGHRIDNVRQAMALSYPIMQINLSRKWAAINITQILPVLLKLTQEIVMILGGSVAVGGAVGGMAGSLAFGIGAAPGAAVGAGIGLQIGNLILMALGLSAIADYFYKGLPTCLATLQEGLATAWAAEEGLPPPALDPTGGSAARIQESTERAARQLAQGQEQLVLLLLTAIVTYLTRGQMKAGALNSMESIAARSAKLQAEISNKEFSNWLAKNQNKILAQPELQVKDQALAKKPEPQTMREYYAEQDPTFISIDDKIKKVKTFETKGLSNEQIENFLDTSDGQKLISKLRAASPEADASIIYRRAFSQVASGSTFPQVKLISHSLIKIVPEGESVSPYSPFFTTRDELQSAAASGHTLADSFGLPLSSETTTYSVYEMAPLKPTEVFISKIAPTSELDGTISRSGGALQYLTPDRGEWGVPKLIGTTSN